MEATEQQVQQQQPTSKIEAKVDIPKYDEHDSTYTGNALKVATSELGRDFVTIGYSDVVRVSDLRHALKVLDATHDASVTDLPF